MEAIPLAGAALGIGQSLFGGKPKQTQQSQSSGFGEQFSQQTGLQQSQAGSFDMTRPEFALLGQLAAGNLGGLLGAGPSSFNSYTGPFTSPTLPGGQQALGGLQTAAFDPARQDLLRQTIQGAFLPGQPGANPFLQSAIQTAQEPTRLALEQAVQRRIPGMFAQAGHTLTPGGSSPYMRELGLAAAQGGRALGDIATQMSFQGYEAERARQQAAISLGQQDVQAMLANLQGQWLPQAIQEQGIDRAIATGQQGVGNLLQAFQVAQGFPLQTTGQQSSSFGTQLADAYGYNRTSSSSSGASTGAGGNLLTGLFGNQGAIPGLMQAFGTTPGQGVRSA